MAYGTEARHGDRTPAPPLFTKVPPMKIALSACALLLLGAATANAADLAPRLVTKAAVDPGLNWSGFYAGVNAGYGIATGTANNTTVDTGAGEVISSTSDAANLKGALGGAQVGYNWQVSPLALFGLEADIQGAAQRFSTTTLPTSGGTPGDFQTVTGKLDWFGTVRGRLGFIAHGTTLLYGTAGFAYGGLSLGLNDNLSNYAGATSVQSGNFSKTAAGWTAGAGIETLLVGNWTARAEYLYVDLGTISGTIPLVANAIPYGIHSGSMEVHDHIVRAGLNYHL